jgi:hypothetical protein
MYQPCTSTMYINTCTIPYTIQCTKIHIPRNISQLYTISIINPIPYTIPTTIWIFVPCHQWSISKNQCMSLMHTSPYNMNIPQPCTRNSNMWAIRTISMLYHTYECSSLNQHYTISKYNTNNTKNALSIHHIICKSNHQNKHETIPELM